MNYEDVTGEAMELVGIETRASNDDPQPIGALWQRFFVEDPLEGVEPIDDTIVAVYHEYDGDYTQPYTFFLGRRVAPGADAPEGLVKRNVAGGRFARFLAEGNQPDALIEAWQKIWSTRLDRRYDADYELHSAEHPTRVEVFVGI